VRIGALCAVLCLCGLIPIPAGAQTTVIQLNDAGWKLIKDGEPEHAAKLFADALKLRPEDPVLLFGAGMSAAMTGRFDEAKDKLRRALAKDPGLTNASLFLGAMLYKEDELDEAIKVYEAAAKLAPDDKQLSESLDRWRKEADVHSGFVERRQDRFSVMFEGRTDTQLATRAAEALRAAFWKIGGELRAFPPDAISVVLYTEQQFRDVTHAPDWTEGIYDGRIRIPVGGALSDPALFDAVLAHELAHAMIASIAHRGVPAWIHEGLAQRFTGADLEAARHRLDANSRRIPLEQLEESFSKLSRDDAYLAYAESLVAVDAIKSRSTVTWTQLLSALAESDSTSQTLRWFNIGYADLDRALAH